MQRAFLYVAILIGIILMAAASYGAPAPDACKAQFYQGQMPDGDWTDTSRVHVLCFSEFSVEEYGVTKTPVWSAEHLTADRVRSAKTIKRQNTFHLELQLPLIDRANLTDYKKSGYDRGHMSPDDDMPDVQSAHESFSLANMVPQNSCNNEIVWKAIETSVRSYVLAHGEAYVITGPLYYPQTVHKEIGADKVEVPEALFKAIYDPAINGLIIVTTPNANVQNYTTMTLDDLRVQTGHNMFPTVHNPIQLLLPPLAHVSGSCKKDVSQGSSGSGEQHPVDLNQLPANGGVDFNHAIPMPTPMAHP